MSVNLELKKNVEKKIKSFKLKNLLKIFWGQLQLNCSPGQLASKTNDNEKKIETYKKIRVLWKKIDAP